MIMKKILLFVFVFLSISTIKASDTLTVRQVYNFNVGDTFDYEHNITNYDLGIFNTQYNRLVISQKVVSPGLDTIIYNGNWVITNLDSIAIYQIDTLYRDTNWMTQTNFLDTTTFVFPGEVSNDISSGFGEGGYSFTVTLGWGETFHETDGIDNSGMNFNTETVKLIYFSDGTRRFGRPYYQVDGIASVSTSDIRLFPTPAMSHIHLSFPNISLYNAQLILTDILGQQVYTSPVSQTESTHDISGLSPGLYIWTILANDHSLKTGKVIKE
jgi:hypothetical protein